MNIHQLSTAHFTEPRFDNNIIKGIPHLEMKNAIDEITAGANDLNRLGIKGFEFVKCTLTDPLSEVQRSIFPYKKAGVKTDRQVLKLDKDGTFMVTFHFRYKGVDLDPAHSRVPYVQAGGKFIMRGKNNFVRSILVDRGINLAKDEIFIQLDRTSFSMARTTHNYTYNHALTCGTVLVGNPHRGAENKKGLGTDKIIATQNLFLYLLSKHGLTKTLSIMEVDIKVITGDSYEDVYSEWYPKGYSVFGSCGIKTGDGGKKSDWTAPNIYMLYKGDLTIGSDMYNMVSMVVANFYYIADRIPSYLSMEIMDATDFWANILARFIFYRPGKSGQWYTDEGINHLVNSMDTLIDMRTRRRLLTDDIDVADTYELMLWLMKNEKEVYANIHPSDVSRKKVTSIRYLLSYILDNLNRLGYKLLGRVDAEGNLAMSMTHKRLSETIRSFIKEGTIRSLVKKEHGEVTTLESPSSNMFITNTRALVDQTKVKGSTKERNHMYNKDNVLHASKVTRCRVDGIDSTPSGSTQINPLSMDMSRDTIMSIPPWLQAIEDELSGDLNGEF